MLRFINQFFYLLTWRRFLLFAAPLFLGVIASYGFVEAIDYLLKPSRVVVTEPTPSERPSETPSDSRNIASIPAPVGRLSSPTAESSRPGEDEPAEPNESDDRAAGGSPMTEAVYQNAATPTAEASASDFSESTSGGSYGTEGERFPATAETSASSNNSSGMSWAGNASPAGTTADAATGTSSGTTSSGDGSFSVTSPLSAVALTSGGTMSAPTASSYSASVSLAPKLSAVDATTPQNGYRVRLDAQGQVAY